MIFAGPKVRTTLASLFLAAGVVIAGLATSPVRAEDTPAPAPAAAPAASAPAAPAPAAAAPAAAAAPDAGAPAAKRAKKKPRAAKPVGSLESRHAVCLAFIQRHGLSCDPWTEPTCGAETGYFRPAECVRPRSQ